MGQQDTVRIGIAGVRGYKGTETARLIARHERFRVAMVSSDAMAGSRLRDIDPDLERDGDAQAVGYNDTVSAARDYGVELMLLATRPELCGQVAPALLDAGIRVIDLSGAHTLEDGDAHVDAYGFVQTAPEVNRRAVYGLPEWTGHEAIASASIVANPTSYAAATLLALGPLARAGLLQPGSVVVDIKCAASAAGRKARMALLFTELAGNFYATAIDRHPHTPELLQALEPVVGPDFKITVASHVLPVIRGMMATCYLRVAGSPDVREGAARVQAALREAYASEPFVRVAERAEDVTLRGVHGTNRCVIGTTADPWGDHVVVIAALDNMLKGAAGNAVQAANVMFGFDQTTALDLGTGGRP